MKIKDLLISLSNSTCYKDEALSLSDSEESQALPLIFGYKRDIYTFICANQETEHGRFLHLVIQALDDIRLGTELLLSDYLILWELLFGKEPSKAEEKLLNASRILVSYGLGNTQDYFPDSQSLLLLLYNIRSANDEHYDVILPLQLAIFVSLADKSEVENLITDIKDYVELNSELKKALRVLSHYALSRNDA